MSLERIPNCRGALVWRGTVVIRVSSKRTRACPIRFDKACSLRACQENQPTDRVVTALGEFQVLGLQVALTIRRRHRATETPCA